MLRFSIRGQGGEASHALLARMRKGGAAGWRCLTLELQRGERSRALDPHRLGSSQLADLAEQAERAAWAKVGVKIPGEGF